MLVLALWLARLGGRPSPGIHEDILRAHIDASISPGDDFFMYANGGWFKRNPIPPTEARWGIVRLVRNELDAKLRKINEDAASTTADRGSVTQKVGDFWATAMDEEKAEQVGLGPLKPLLDRVDKAANLDDLVSLSFELQRYRAEPFFDIEVAQDEKRSDVMAVHLWQGGLGLPDRDYYVDPSATFIGYRKEYVIYLQGLLARLGGSDAEAGASKVMAFETALARISRKLQDLRDSYGNYTKMPLADVQRKLTPSIDWADSLRAWNVRPSTVIVGQPEFFSGLNGLLEKTPIETLRDYLRVRLLSSNAAYLDRRTDALDFNFNHRVLSGQMEPQPRWKRVMVAEDRAIGFLLGRLYVKQFFPPATKKRYTQLVKNILRAFSRRIDRLDWMSAATKAKAHQKLAAMRAKIGYPDVWKNYSGLQIGRGSYCQNMMNAKRWSFDDMLSKLGKPSDDNEWNMTPQTYDGYYSVSNNEIVFPAGGFVIPGMQDSEIDDALAYGYVFIGHEITHGFDDQGRQFDAKGNLADWWTKDDAARFEQRAKVLVAQFNAYEPLPGMHINGQATLGENMADYGGLLVDLDAFKTTRAYKSGKKIGGLTPLQRFFLGWDLGWLDERRPAELRRQLITDVHSPAKWRVNGPFSNIPDFYKAFGIKPGQPMWRPPSQRAHIW